MAGSPLRDRRILVVEDEYLIAMSLQDALESAGSVVLGPVPSVEKAIKQNRLRAAHRRRSARRQSRRRACLSRRGHARRPEYSVHLHLGL